MHKPAPQERHNRAESHDEVAVLLPFFGTLLLMPPILNLFTGGRTIGGIPLEGLYLLVVWIGVIVGAGILIWLPAFRRSTDAKSDGPETSGES